MTRRKLSPLNAGDKCGRWRLEREADPVFYSGYPHKRWVCLCDCGVRRIVKDASLKVGISTSCGCLTRERSSEVNRTHGRSQSGSEYSSWCAMIQRCHNPNNTRFKDYGGRGIVVCQKWRDSFEAFLADMGPKPSPRHSIDRIKNSLSYAPGNCQWSLPHTQMTNRRNSFYIAVGKRKVPLSDLASEYNIPANTLRGRIVAGWPLKRALYEPVRAKRSAKSSNH